MLHNLTEKTYRKLADWLLEDRRDDAETRVIGINGPQGSGKSTLARFIAQELAQRASLRCAVLSIDDLYLTRAQRRDLAAEVHPLLATRGVPGTHDADWGISLIEQIRDLKAGKTLALPRFNKTEDDRHPPDRWTSLEGPIDLLLFEGWCVGTPAQTASRLGAAINPLEAQEDPDGCWRQYVNTQLTGPYARWFAQLDRLIFLQIPDFDLVRRWRGQQEEENLRREQGRHALDPLALDRFIQHYERLSRHAMDCMPQRADALLRLRADHVVDQLVVRAH